MSDNRGFGGRSARRPKDDGSKAKFGQLWPYMAPFKRSLWLAAGLSVVSAAFSLGQPLLVGQVITAVQKQQDMLGLILLLVLFIALSAVVGGFQYYILTRTGEGVVLTARNRLAGRLLRLPIHEYDQRRTGDLVSRVSSDTTLLRAVLTQGLVDAIGGVLMFFGAIIAMAFIDPVLLGATLAVILVAVVSIVLVASRIRAATTAAQARVGAMAAAVERALSAIRTIRASRAEARETDEISANAQSAYVQGVKIARISSAISPIAGIAMNGSFIVVLGLGGWRVASGATTIANLVSFILLLFLLIRPLGSAFGAYSSVQTALGALARIQEVLDITTEDELPQVGELVPRVAQNDIALEFVGVDFEYAAPAEAAGGDGAVVASTKPVAPVAAADIPAEAQVASSVLKNVSFKVARGSRVAIVGPSGAGKSTILSLIERFYEPTGGEIRLDGQVITSISRDELRAQLGYVEQDAPVLAGTIRANLLLGTPAATDEQLVEVLEAVNLTEVFERDSRGLDAEVGENGVMLSGGERQRLAIARTLLTANPILLLDESTAALDGLNEQRMREAIDAVAQQRTLIVIAHRLSTVVDSDQIIVLEAGSVVGVGTHSELVKSTPLYRDLAKHQLLV
jgi:ATP-binding cassette subfamily B protein